MESLPPWAVWTIIGLVAGILAKFLMPGRDPGGIIITILLGIAGAFVGGFISTKLGYGGFAVAFDWRNVIIATGGALVLLILYRIVVGNKKRYY